MSEIPRSVIDEAAERARRNFEREVLYGHWDRPPNIGLPSVTHGSRWPMMNTETFRANFLRFPWWR